MVYNRLFYIDPDIYTIHNEGEWKVVFTNTVTHYEIPIVFESRRDIVRFRRTLQFRRLYRRLTSRCYLNFIHHDIIYHLEYKDKAGTEDFFEEFYKILTSMIKYKGE